MFFPESCKKRVDYLKKCPFYSFLTLFHAVFWHVGGYIDRNHYICKRYEEDEWGSHRPDDGNDNVGWMFRQ
jgi:hypothetical protein